MVEPGGRRVLIATGNGPYNGTTQFGDSLIELTLPDLRLRQVYTPTNQAQLNSSDTDLGSGSPALLPGGLAWIAGKDSIQRVVSLAAMDGRSPGSPARTGGELQTLPTPGNQQIFSAPAVWHSLLFVADTSGTGAYRVVNGRLHERNVDEEGWYYRRDGAGHRMLDRGRLRCVRNLDCRHLLRVRVLQCRRDGVGEPDG